MSIHGWLSLRTCICPSSSSQENTSHLIQRKENELERMKKYKDAIDFDTNENRICDELVCKCGCRLRAIVRLIMSGLGFTFLVSGIVVAMVGSADSGTLCFCTTH